MDKDNVRRIIRQLQSSLDELELEILRTPTSEVRNQLTDANIHGKEAIRILLELA